MLTKLTVRNFKQFKEVAVDLGNPVVFIGPNDSGKTSALQVLTLWELGLRRWTERRKGSAASERSGVAINRRDLAGIPLPSARQLWRDLHVRSTSMVNGSQRTENVRIDVVVDGITEEALETPMSWRCGLEFDFANEESIYCRPLRTTPNGSDRMAIPEHARAVRVALLGPMSGLAANETKLEPGAVNVRIGEGRTAEVLRNLCYQIIEGPDGEVRWARITTLIEELFGARIGRPEPVVERGEITMGFTTSRGVSLDLASSGRGMQQTLLLLAFLQLHSGSVVLLDEPDAHLEILRQRQTYRLLSDLVRESESQVLMASHSEVILNEAARRESDTVVAFVGRPHNVGDRGTHVLKALREIGYEDYYQADVTGWVLYLEGSTDLDLLHALAARLGHQAATVLERPFVHYVCNQPSRVKSHFHGLLAAKPDLVGFALFDRLNSEDQHDDTTRPLTLVSWRRREIENYICQPEALVAYARASGQAEFPGDMFRQSEGDRRAQVMQRCIEDRIPPAALRDRADRYWMDTKASDEILDPIFDAYFSALGLPVLLRKGHYHELVRHVPTDEIDSQVHTVLDALVAVVETATPGDDSNA